MPEVMGQSFEPRRMGRPPSVDIRPLKEMVDNNPGYWVQEHYSSNDAASVRRQFQKLGGYKVTTAKSEIKGERVVMVKLDW
jgi:hypothetical protein